VNLQIKKAYEKFFENDIVKTHMPAVNERRFLKDEYHNRYVGLKAYEKFPLTPEEFLRECETGEFKSKYGVNGKSVDQYVQENPFNPNSTTQLQMFFEETKMFWDEKHQRHIWPLLTEKGAASFTEDSIYKYGDVGYILHEAIEVKKVGEKLTKLEEDSRHESTAHFSINTVATKTGRISGNGLNIPACPFDNPLFGSCLISGEGASILSVDYASLEPFLAAVLSKDPLLLYAIDGGIGKSPFTKNGVLMIDDPYIMLGSVISNFQAKIAELVTPEAWLADSEAVKKSLKAERFIMKVTFLSSLYGAQPPKVLETLLKNGVKITYKEVKKIVDDMNSLFAGLTLFKHQVKTKAVAQSFINNPLGFPCHVQNTAPHKIFNKYIQSTAAMVMKYTVSSLWAHIKDREIDVYPLIINLHDAFFLRVRDENIEEMKTIIFDHVLPEVNSGIDFCAKLRMSIDIGKNFYEIKG
jgi:DNA polymerase I-like protein with 3'-5' exonuclease and polymerase domains